MSFRELEQSHADLSKVPPLEPNRLTGFINHFAANLVEQLRNLNDAADQRLYRLHTRLLICKTNLLILEKKLDSVDGLSVPSNAAAAAVQTPPTQPQSDAKSESVIEAKERVSEETEESSNELMDEADGKAIEAKDDPEMQRFYKMLKVGVPLPAVRMKMVSEGVDPDRLKL